MKKTFFVALFVVAALGIAVTAGFAQAPQPEAAPYGGGYGPRMMQAGPFGPIHQFVVDAFADAVKMDAEAVNTALASGQTMFQVALESGVAEADIPALLQSVHETALNKAVEANVLTAEQAAWMLERMQGAIANCDGTGSHTMMRAADGTGFRGGMRGGRGAQPKP